MTTPHARRRRGSTRCPQCRAAGKLTIAHVQEDEANRIAGALEREARRSLDGKFLVWVLSTAKRIRSRAL